MRQRIEDQYGRLLLVPEIRFARAAVFRLLEPSPPMVTVYGAPGSGKTHLARQFVREINRRQPELKLSHMTAAEFCGTLAIASDKNSLPEFQESFRSLDVFICEDLQTFEGRRKSQIQLLAILDQILNQGGRVLLTSSKPPGELSKFSPKLRSRCQGGVCAAIEQLSRSSREKLLVHLAAEQGLVLPDDVAALLADSLTVSAREMCGMIRQLDHRSRLRRTPIDRGLAEEIIRESVVSATPTIGEITKIVARTFSVNAADLKSPGRLQGLVLPRQLAMYAAKEWAQQAYAEIGRYFSRRSHSTIVHACQRVRKKMETDPDFRRIVDSIQEQLRLPQTAADRR